MENNTEMPEVCDYEGSNYRTEFWEGQGRDYEDRAERIAIRRLMPLEGGRLLELGAGFGRLSQMFSGYKQVVLLDYSRSQLEFAREQMGDDGFLYVAANIYEMPFAPGAFDAATMIRVLHHMEDAPAVLKGVRQILKQNAVFLLEYANKQNIKAILRYLLRKQTWSPFSEEPVEFVELNFDFHPRYVERELEQANFAPGRKLTVSHYRIGILKKLVPTGILVFLDSMAQLSGNLWQLSPSVFVLNVAKGASETAPEGAFWRCPACGGYDLIETDNRMTCQSCNAQYGIYNGVYDFKEQISST